MPARDVCSHPSACHDRTNPGSSDLVSRWADYCAFLSDG